jgi:hypothetical protein
MRTVGLSSPRPFCFPQQQSKALQPTGLAELVWIEGGGFLDQHFNPDHMPTVRHQNQGWHSREPSGWHAGNHPSSDRCLRRAQCLRRSRRVAAWTREDLRAAKSWHLRQTSPGLSASGHRSPRMFGSALLFRCELRPRVAEGPSQVKTALKSRLHDPPHPRAAPR